MNYLVNLLFIVNLGLIEDAALMLWGLETMML